MSVLLYLIKVLVLSGILTGYYWLFLRNKRFHHYNRFFLLGILLLSIILPFIRIPVSYHPDDNSMNHVVYQAVDVLSADSWEDESGNSTESLAHRLFTLENGCWLLYLAGLTLLLAILIRSLLYIRKISRQYPCEKVNILKFYNTREPGTPFSFFRSVFWNAKLDFNSKEGQQIFRHEMFHVLQHHSADLLLAEIINTIFWFNPFFYLARKELKAIHEFLADQYAMSGNDRYAYAELLVKQALHSKYLSVTNPFFQNHIKRRLAMITQFNQSKYGYWSRIMILPVSFILFCATVLYAQQQPVSQDQSFAAALLSDKLNVVIDAGHGGSDPGATSSDGKVLEKDLTLQISNRIAELAPQYNINVILTRTGDYLPGNTNDKSAGLKYRTDIAKNANANLFISIHVNTAQEAADQSKGGFELYIPKNNQSMLEPSRHLGTALLNSIGSIFSTNPSLLQRQTNGIYVLDKSSCPAVLIECGYITNDQDVQFVGKKEIQEQLAKKILEGIKSYRESWTERKTTSFNESETDATNNAIVQNAALVQDTIPAKEKKEKEPKMEKKDMKVYIKEAKEEKKEIKEDIKYKVKLDTKAKVNSEVSAVRSDIKDVVISDKQVVISDMKNKINSDIRLHIDTLVIHFISEDVYKVKPDSILYKKGKSLKDVNKINKQPVNWKLRQATQTPSGLISVNQFKQILNSGKPMQAEISQTGNYIKVIVDGKSTYYISKDEIEKETGKRFTV